MPSPEAVYGKTSSIMITGASSGIGAALACYLGQYGGRIALLARREEALQQVAERVRAAGGQPLLLVNDVTDPEAVARAHQQVIEAQGAVDVAFLNAGVGNTGSVKRFDARAIRRAFEVNVFGVVNWIGELLPTMIERRQGIIAGTSSLAAARGLPGAGGYSASKAALSTLLETLRAEAQTSGVQISTIEPGFVRSPITDRNKYHMPFLMAVEPTARIIAARVAAGHGVIRFPWSLSAMVQLMSMLPTPLYDQLSRRLIKAGRTPHRN